jgi:hypothetical protein
MRGKYVHQVVLATLMIYTFPVCFGNDTPDPNESTKYLNAVRELPTTCSNTEEIPTAPNTRLYPDVFDCVGQAS